MAPYQIILADDHVLFRQGIKKIIGEKNDFKVIGEANNGVELLKLFKKIIPEMVILDISMPNLRGIEVTSEIKRFHPNVKILILTMHKNKEFFHEAISAGADGYLLKEDADTELFSAVETIRQGKVYISPLLRDELMDDWVRNRKRGQYRKPRLHLTLREREVLKLIADGKTSREISELLFISFRTVQHHRRNIMEKLNLRKTASLIKYAIKKQYTSLGE